MKSNIKFNMHMLDKVCSLAVGIVVGFVMIKHHIEHSFVVQRRQQHRLMSINDILTESRKK